MHLCLYVCTYCTPDCTVLNCHLLLLYWTVCNCHHLLYCTELSIQCVVMYCDLLCFVPPWRGLRILSQHVSGDVKKSMSQTMRLWLIRGQGSKCCKLFAYAKMPKCVILQPLLRIKSGTLHKVQFSPIFKKSVKKIVGGKIKDTESHDPAI